MKRLLKESKLALSLVLASMFLSIYVPVALAEDNRILVDDLEDIGIESTGIIDDEQGGLGINLWNGTHRELVVNLLGLLPDRYPSLVLKNLSTRLLLTNAIAPIKSGIGKNNTDADLNYLRASQLFGMGEVELALEFSNLALPLSLIHI